MLMFNPYAVQGFLHLMTLMLFDLESYYMYDFLFLPVKNEVDSSLVALDQKSKEEAISLLELNRHDHQRALYSVYK